MNGCVETCLLAFRGSIGYSQSPPSPLTGYAAVLGVYGLGFVIALLAALLAVGWRSLRHIALVLIILTLGFSLTKIDWTTPQGKPLAVNLLQGNVPQDIKWSPQQIAFSVERYVALVSQTTPTRDPALTVLPETALPLFLNEVPREVLQSLTQHGDVLVGVPVVTNSGGYANAAVAISPALAMQAYAKRHLWRMSQQAI